MAWCVVDELTVCSMRWYLKFCYIVEPSELLMFMLKGLGQGEPAPVGERAVLPGISSTSLPPTSCCIMPLSAEFLPRKVFHVACFNGLLSGDLIVTGV
jgi:hypothetical protein